MAGQAPSGGERRVSEADRALFRSSVADARPLHNGARAAPPSSSPEAASQPARPVCRRAAPPPRRGLPGESPRGPAGGGGREFMRAGVRRREFDRLGRRGLEVHSIDLHGCRLEAARDVLRSGIRCCTGRYLRVIHGRGRHSPQGRSALLEQVPEWLRRDSKVLAFRPAHVLEGGAGALDVLLKNPPGRRP